MYSVLDSVGTDGILITFDQKLAELLNNWEPNGWPVGNLILVLIALVLSVVLCGLVGIERELRGRSAGLRTHLLVGVGSCLIMIISIYGFPAMFGEKRDVARLAAQIITGVGFLGAGAIIHHNSGIKGLTTAGTIWVAMAIGIACGSLNFILAVAATLIIMFVLVTIRKFEVRINHKKPYIVISAPMSDSLLEKIILVSKEYECSVQGLASEVIEDEKGRRVEVSFQAVFTCAKPNISEYVAKLEKETNAINVQLFGHKA